MTDMSKLLDTWGWIEFYEGSQIGERVYRELENGEIYTSILTLAELSDNYARDNFRTDHTWNQVKGFIRENSGIVRLTPQIAGRAGELKNEKRENFPDFGMMDALILATAKEEELKLMTGDPHLTGDSQSIDLREQK